MTQSAELLSPQAEPLQSFTTPIAQQSSSDPALQYASSVGNQALQSQLTSSAAPSPVAQGYESEALQMSVMGPPPISFQSTPLTSTPTPASAQPAVQANQSTAARPGQASQTTSDAAQSVDGSATVDTGAAVSTATARKGTAPVVGGAVTPASPAPTASAVSGGLAAEASSLDGGALDFSVLPPLVLPTAPYLPALPSSDIFVPPRPLRNQQPASQTMSAAAGNRLFSQVSRRFDGATRGFAGQHNAIFNHGLQTLASLAQQLEQARFTIPAHLINADSQVETELLRSQALVVQSATAATETIGSSYVSARRSLLGAAGTARTAIKANADSADTQGKKVVDELSKDRIAFVNTVNDDIAQSSFYADDQVKKWLADIATTYPISGSELTPATHETYQASAPSLATAVRGNIADRAHAMSAMLIAAAGQITANISAAVKPTFDNHRDRIRSDGVNQVETAINAGLYGLRQQSQRAKDAVVDMRESALGQLAAQRRGARAQLERQAAQALNDVFRQVSVAQEQITGSLGSTLPHYSVAAGELRETLTQAGSGGPEALQVAADAVIPTVEQSVLDGNNMQRTQIDAIGQGSRDGVVQTQQKTAQELMNQVSASNRALADGGQLSAENIQSTAVTMTAGFANAADGVNRAAAMWAMPLAKLFADFIKGTQELIKSKEGEFVSQLDKDTRPLREYLFSYSKPKEILEKPGLSDTFIPVRENLQSRVDSLDGKLRTSWYQNTDEGGITGAFHGLTWAKGVAVKHLWWLKKKTDLLSELRSELGSDSDDYDAAYKYLSGRAEEGALAEMKASVRWYNDDEARIEKTQRALSPKQIAKMQEVPGAGETLGKVRDALDGTDRDVFDALKTGDYALADTLRMKEKLDQARQRNDDDAANAILTEYSAAPKPEDWGYQTNVSAETRWSAIKQDFSTMRGVTVKEGATVEQTMTDYVLRDIEVTRSDGEGGQYTETLRVSGRQRDLATAIIATGGTSALTKATRIGVEEERRGGPNLLNLDTALVDERLNPNNPVPEHIRTEARREREEVLRIYAQKYGGTGATADVNAATVDLVRQLRARFDADDPGANLAAALVEQPYPTPATAAVAMKYAQDGAGTREEIIWRFSERMNRDEIAQMRAAYDGDLYADLGVFGHGGVFTELSGDDRLRAERAFLGKPRNDREKAEVAAFAMHQQREETGAIGRWWAEGSLAEGSMQYNEQRLSELVGSKITFGEDGLPIGSHTDAFDADGRFKGDRADLGATALSAQNAAQSYAAEVDRLAGMVTMAIAIAGAIAAGVATVMTGGAASPLLMAAIAGVTGAASMGAQWMIKGGRYGWEQAATDLGMTAVEMLTAGVAQSLSLASRGGTAGLRAGLGLASKSGEKGAGLIAQMSLKNARQLAVQNVDEATRLLGNMGRITGSKFGDQLLIGGTTSAISSVGQTALNEQTYAQGSGKAVDNLLGSLFRGAFTGTVTAGVTNAFDYADKVKGLGKAGKWLAEAGGSTSVTQRGLHQALTSGAGGFAGKYAELGFEAGRGEYHGDAGDMFIAALQAGAHSAGQSGLEGMASALGQRNFNRFAQPHNVQLEAAQLRILPHDQQVAELKGQMVMAAGNPDAIRALVGKLAYVDPVVRNALLESGLPQVQHPTEGGVAVPKVAATEAELGVPRAVDSAETTTPLVRTAGGDLVPAAEILPHDLRNRVPVQHDPDLTGNAVRVMREPELHIRIGPNATAEDIALHISTVRDMQRAEGLLGLVQRATDRIVGDPRRNSVAGEAYQELDKLPAIIEDRMGQMRHVTDPLEQQRLRGELDSLFDQYRQHSAAARSGDERQGRGYVAMEDTTTQIDRLYGGELKDKSIRTIDAEIARLVPSEEAQKRLVAHIIANATNPDDAKVLLVNQLHRVVLQMGDVRTANDPEHQQLMARIGRDLQSNNPETMQGAVLLIRYLADNHGDIISGKKTVGQINATLAIVSSADLARLAEQHAGGKSLTLQAFLNLPEAQAGGRALRDMLSSNPSAVDLGKKTIAQFNEMLEVLSPANLARLTAEGGRVKPTSLLESLSAIVRVMDSSAELPRVVALRMGDLGDHPAPKDVSALLANRDELRRQVQRAELLELVRQLQLEGVANPIGELARHIDRLRLQDPAAIITPDRLHQSIDRERLIADLVARGNFSPDELFQRLHDDSKPRTAFDSRSEVYQYFRNKMAASAQDVDQSFQANLLIDALVRGIRTHTDPELLAQWQAFHTFIETLDIRVNGQPFGRKRQMLGQIWEDIYFRTMSNRLGPPGELQKGNLWDFHVNVQGANFDAVVVHVSKNRARIAVVDAKISGAPFSENQQRVEPHLQTLAAGGSMTKVQFLAEFPPQSAVYRLVVDAFGGQIPDDAMIILTVTRAESQERPKR
jgi:hypothetical protein